MRKKGIVILAVLLSCILLGAGVFGYRHYQQTYITIDGVRYERAAAELDMEGKNPAISDLMEMKELKRLNLRGVALTAEEFDQLCAALPECQIRWSVPLSQGSVDDDVRTLELESVTSADVDMLALFTQLEAVDATSCRDYKKIRTIMERYPHLDVTYQVEIGGDLYPQTTSELKTPGEDLKALAERLQFLPDVKTVALTAPVTDADGLSALLEQYPDIDFSWTVKLLGKTFTSADEEIDISGIPLTDTKEVEAAVTCLPNVRKVLMLDCGISNEEMGALNDRWEDPLFVWNLKLGKYITVRTDVKTFMPIIQHKYAVFDWFKDDLKYLTELECLDLGHNPINSCEFVEYMPHLKYLILADSPISDISPVACLKELVFLELFLTRVKDVSPLINCTALEDLNIGHLSVDPEVLIQIKSLKRLWWSRPKWNSRRLTMAQRQMMQEALPDTQMEFRFYSSTGGEWRRGQHYYDMRDMLGMKYLWG